VLIYRGRVACVTGDRHHSLKIVLSVAGECVTVYIIHDASLFLSHNIAVVATSPIMQGRVQNFGKGAKLCPNRWQLGPDTDDPSQSYSW